MNNSSTHHHVDHLFRHQYGKMVAVLTNFFGLSHLELVEDAVQDTFIKATLQWRQQQPDQPEAWLMQAAKNRAVDLLRKIKADQTRHLNIQSGASAIPIQDIFMNHEVADSQLRMIFVACHPALSRDEQIAFALKTISGFSMKEIATALLIKDETIKKRLVRARKKLIDQHITLSYPQPHEIEDRMAGVLQIIYLIFNEGFHSTKTDRLVSKDLCGEALRLCKLLLQNENLRQGSVYALFALLCFHSSRLDSKINHANEIVDLEHQDRSKWYLPLIVLGNDALDKSKTYSDWSAYHFEAEIAAEHVQAIRFENTNWERILHLYEQFYNYSPSDQILLSMAAIYLRLKTPLKAKSKLNQIDGKRLGQRFYLLKGAYAEYFHQTRQSPQAITEIDLAITHCSNALEKAFLQKKKHEYSRHSSS